METQPRLFMHRSAAQVYVLEETGSHRSQGAGGQAFRPRLQRGQRTAVEAFRNLDRLGKGPAGRVEAQHVVASWLGIPKGPGVPRRDLSLQGYRTGTVIDALDLCRKPECVGSEIAIAKRLDKPASFQPSQAKPRTAECIKVRGLASARRHGVCSDFRQPAPQVDPTALQAGGAGLPPFR